MIQCGIPVSYDLIGVTPTESSPKLVRESKNTSRVPRPPPALPHPPPALPRHRPQVPHRLEPRKVDSSFGTARTVHRRGVTQKRALANHAYEDRTTGQPGECQTGHLGDWMEGRTYGGEDAWS